MDSVKSKSTLEEIYIETQTKIERNTYSKNVPLARYYDVKKLELLEAILDKLSTLEKRLHTLEEKVA